MRWLGLVQFTRTPEVIGRDQPDRRGPVTTSGTRSQNGWRVPLLSLGGRAGGKCHHAPHSTDETVGRRKTWIWRVQSTPPSTTACCFVGWTRPGGGCTPLRLHLKYKQAGTEGSTGRSRDVESIALLIPHTSAGAECGREFPHVCVVVGVYLLHHAQKSLAAGHIDALSAGVS
jgi:hypothetical protein